MLVTGPNGAGKTNLLEALHVGSQGFSPRTRPSRGSFASANVAARVRLRGVRGRLAGGDGGDDRAGGGQAAAPERRARSSAEVLRARLAALVFTPDRLAVVKGAPLVRQSLRRPHARPRLPCPGAASRRVRRALAQRNEALRRVRARRLALRRRRAVDAPGCRARRRARSVAAPTLVRLSQACSRAHAEPSGSRGLAGLRATRRSTVEELESTVSSATSSEGRPASGRTCATSRSVPAGRDLRSFGSQGEQRTAVLALAPRGGGSSRSGAGARRSCSSTTSSASSTRSAVRALLSRAARGTPERW